jgi:hypothetical protein
MFGDPFVILPVAAMLYVLPRLILGWLIARHAHKKGYSYWLFFIPGVLFSLITTLIMAVKLPSRQGESR